MQCLKMLYRERGSRKFQSIRIDAYSVINLFWVFQQTHEVSATLLRRSPHREVTTQESLRLGWSTIQPGAGRQTGIPVEQVAAWIYSQGPPRRGAFREAALERCEWV